MEPFIGNIRQLALENQSYRKVIDTGNYSQIVLMSLKPLEDIPEEIHHDGDQIINIVGGTALAKVNGKEYILSSGMIIMIKAGLKHYIKNTSSTQLLKLFTIYSPPEHAYGLEQINKQTGGSGAKKYYIEYDEPQNVQTGGKKMKNKSNKGGTNNLMDLKPKYIETLSEPWFTLISLGFKTVEGRKNKGRFKEMQVGDLVQWTNSDFMPRCVLTRITGKAEYKTFEDYLNTEGLDKCLPGMPDIEHGLSVYFKYFTKEDEAEFGVVAIRLELVN